MEILLWVMLVSIAIAKVRSKNIDGYIWIASFVVAGGTLKILFLLTNMK